VSTFSTPGNVNEAQNNLGGTSNLALNNLFPSVTAKGANLFNQAQPIISQGAGNIESGANFLNTILNGNQTNTTALLQPSIDQIRAGTQQNLQQASTLMPRGGGRTGSLFNLSTQPEQQIQNLFNTSRTAAATALPQIGLGQLGAGTGVANAGTNLFNTGVSSLNAATGANTSLGNQALEEQKIKNSLWGSIGGGLFNLATLPLGGGSGLLGSLLGKIPGLGGGGGGGMGYGWSPAGSEGVG